MKRRIRRVVLLAALAGAAGVLQAEPPASANVCAVARVWFNYTPMSVGDCVSTGFAPLCWGGDITHSGVGVGETVCVPLP